MATAMPGLGATLLTAVTTVVEDAGATLRERYTPHARGVSLKEVVEETCANDDAVLSVLRQPLLELRPGSRWVEDGATRGRSNQVGATLRERIQGSPP